MKLIFHLPNGDELDLLGDGPNDMEYVCQICGEYKTPISELLEAFKQETNDDRRQDIADEIRDQAFYYADMVAAFDEYLQQKIGWHTLAEQIYHCLITFANNESKRQI